MLVNDSALDHTSTIEPSEDEIQTGIQFLLAELDNLRGFKEQSVDIGDKRVDIFMALATALIAGLGLLSQSSINAQSFFFVSFCGVLGLLILGAVIFQQVIERDILIVDYIRAINRIRSYFAETTPHIQPFLLMPVSHRFPNYNWQSSNRRIPMVINGLSGGTAVTLITLLLRRLTVPDFISLLFAASSFVVIYMAQSFYASRLFGQAEVKARQYFTVSLFDAHERRESVYRLSDERD